jgi:hypothetical protein
MSRVRTKILRGQILKTVQCFIGIFLLILFSEPAAAYLDPGTGSMLLQVILGGVAAVAVALKLFWYKIRAAFGGGKASIPTDESES